VLIIGIWCYFILECFYTNPLRVHTPPPHTQYNSVTDIKVNLIVKSEKIQ